MNKSKTEIMKIHFLVYFLYIEAKLWTSLVN